MSSAPSGRQIELTHGSARAVITEVGATLRIFEVDGTDVVDPFDLDAVSDGGHGQLLLPWPNRVEDGRYVWEGNEQQLPLTEPAAHNANHGLARWLAWDLQDQTSSSARLGCVIAAQPGWPFRVNGVVTYVLGDHRLDVDLRMVNVGDVIAPGALGAHPYLSTGGGLVDDCAVRVPASSALVVDDRGIPIRREPVAGSDNDFTAFRRVGDQAIDTCFGDLARSSDGRARVELKRPDGHTASVEVDASSRHLQIYTGDKLRDVRRRRSLAVEPMTAPPNALRSGEDLAVLEPGESLSLTWSIALEASGT